MTIQHIPRAPLEKLSKAYPQVAKLLQEYDKALAEIKALKEEVAKLQQVKDML